MSLRFKASFVLRCSATVIEDTDLVFRKDLFSSMLPKYPELLDSGLRILVFSGDVVHFCLTCAVSTTKSAYSQGLLSLHTHI